MPIVLGCSGIEFIARKREVTIICILSTESLFSMFDKNVDSFSHR